MRPRQGRRPPTYQLKRAGTERWNFYVSLLTEVATKGRMPIMDHGDIGAGEISSRRNSTLSGVAVANQPARCGAMIKQRDDHGLQSWPQQFIRLVGGHRRPGPMQAAPATN